MEPVPGAQGTRLQREIQWEIPHLRLRLQWRTQTEVLMTEVLVVPRARARAAHGPCCASGAWADPGALSTPQAYISLHPNPKSLTLRLWRGRRVACSLRERERESARARAHTHTHTHTGRMEVGTYRWQRWTTLSLNSPPPTLVSKFFFSLSLSRCFCVELLLC